MTKEVAKVEQDATELVVDQLVRGLSVQSIRELLAKSHPDADFEVVLRSAVDHFAKSAKCDPEVAHGFALEAYREIYRMAMATVDLQAAIRAINELVKLVNYVQRYQEENEDGEPERAEAVEVPSEPAAGKRRRSKKRPASG